MGSKGGFSLEERLLQNAVDTVVKNRDEYEVPVLIHLVQAVVERKDLAPGLYRILASALTTDQLKEMGLHVGGMAGTGDDVMNYLTMPKLHRTLLRGIQQMQEKLMPGGFLMTSKDVDHTDATCMLRDCTTQLEKVLRLTKSARANAEVLRLKEALGDGLKAIAAEMGKEHSARAYEIMTAAINASLTKTQVALDIEMKDAEELTG